nr:hypothetical protein [uncultured Brevundimonas sp.]
MTSDLRTFVAKDLRIHPRVAYQGMFTGEDVAPELASDLPPMPPFRSDYFGAISVVDWDHRLPSRDLILRVYAFYTESAYAAGEEAFDDRLEDIGTRDISSRFVEGRFVDQAGRIRAAHGEWPAQTSARAASDAR